jgi:hypothetical protein
LSYRLDKSIPKVIGERGRFFVLSWRILFLKHLPVVLGLPEVVSEGGNGIGNCPADDVPALAIL